MNSSQSMGTTLGLLNALIEGCTSRSDEREILDLLRGASAQELDATIEAVDMVALFDAVDNHLIGEDHRDELIELLAHERRGDLGLHAQAALVHGMQPGRTGRVMEEAIRDILLSHEGNELTHLKNRLNLSKNRHDLQGLLFHDIDDEDIRAAILDHFAAQPPLEGSREAKVLSDIDDTAVARLHETRYPRGTVIPGVMEFYDSLDRGPDDAPVSRGDLTFVTARPSDAMGFVKGHSRDSLDKAGLSDLSIMTGSIFNLFSHDAMASKKVENIAEYAQMFPEYDLVFMGDSGQGDIAVGEKILDEHPEALKAVFIHDVVAMSTHERLALARKGIWVVDTYVGAVMKAYELGLVSRDSIRRVAQDAARELDAVVWDSRAQEHATRLLHQRDAELAAGVA